MSRAPSLKGIVAAVLLGALLPGAVAVAEDEGCTEREFDEYLQRLQRLLSDNWRLPSNYRDVNCTLRIVQSFRGEVLDATVEDCTNPELRRSIEDAAYLSSPLPLPGNAACFQREIVVRVTRQPD